MTNHSALELYKSTQDQLLKTFMSELERNPHFSTSTLQSNEHTHQFSKQFLKDIFSNLSQPNFPDYSTQHIEPALKFWHHRMKDFVKSGFSIKDTALLIYAFKSSLQTLKNKTVDCNLEGLKQFETILDILGMLTFELYSIENERLISRQSAQINYLQTHDHEFDSQLIGNSKAMNAVYKAIGLVLENDLTVLLEGESGTGKDLIASTIHQNSKRSNKPFIAINCGAIPKDLIESELFGHEKGAFTGAVEKRIGKFELADGGTLFLDEVGELPLDLQVKFLRILQNKQVERVGGDKPISINVRIIAATNQPLKRRVDDKLFRLDLYYRLNIFPIYVPSLRDRKEDIPALAYHFIEKFSSELNMSPPSMTDDAIQFLKQQPWEGNIRELENTIQRSLVLSQGQPITSSVLSMLPGQSDPLFLKPSPLLLSEMSSRSISYSPSATPRCDESETIPTLEESEKQAISHAITVKKGNMAQVAKALKISRTTLYSKIKKYAIELDL